MILAQKFKRKGIDVVFGPMMDVGADEYIYSSNPYEVAVLGETIRRAMEKGGIISIPKHYPGLDERGFDTHKESVYYTQSDYERGLIPFSLTIERGTRALMMGHGSYLLAGAKDAEPATFSRPIISDLRNKLKFSGLIVADDVLQMKALQNKEKQFTSSQSGAIEINRYVSAIMAGNDMVLMFSLMPEGELINSISKTVEGLIAEKKMSVNDIDRSVRKIIDLKRKAQPEAMIFKKTTIEIVKRMSLTEKVAQTIVYMYVKDPPQRVPLGMYVFYNSRDRLPWLTNEKRLRRESSVVPILVATDQRKSLSPGVDAMNMLVSPNEIGRVFKGTGCKCESTGCYKYLPH